MKIAISTTSGNPDKEFSPRFGRCAYFLIVDEGGDNWEKISNPAVNAQGGAGTQVVQYLAGQGVEVVISGRYGPFAFEALEAGGINAYLASSGTPRELLEQVQDGSLRKASGPSGEGMHDNGSGRGSGRGVVGAVVEEAVEVWGGAAANDTDRRSQWKGGHREDYRGRSAG